MSTGQLLGAAPFLESDLIVERDAAGLRVQQQMIPIHPLDLTARSQNETTPDYAPPLRPSRYPTDTPAVFYLSLPPENVSQVLSLCCQL